jgi:hypothetical protein
MERSVITLQYPNGRQHRATLPLPRTLKVGDEFGLYGRRWQVVAPKGRSRMQGPLCVSTAKLNASSDEASPDEA